ncbi:restriction endonuclease [Neobacillus sp. 3P2-tot-E-2]|uniref:nSTAND3 domain-containing NTPase n=1 Tax=Neobacillus sp. 3P2-tot-E-2 TaxID=3132212 RepID=UPI0039A3B355
MYDFTNLSDVEFERLSADILSRKLGVKLRYFAPGRDGGIDLLDDAVQKNIVVQVKHYAKSSFNSLLTSLKKEVAKVKVINPKHYYICVSQELTALNINEIYNLFKEYMKDSSHIITRSELVESLNEDGNQDILRKNFKLWLLSDKLLKDIFNNQVFIDSEVLLDDINEDFNYFVQTAVFTEALETIKKHRMLMLYGAPGVGKSINSKMLAATFAKEDYIIRYTTDGQVSNIKSVLSENPDVKEVILLDDCLGQYYFNLKSGQDRELISLIKYIKHHKNKILILNTRVTILNEAKRARFEFRDFLDQERIHLKSTDMESISRSEKAEIFYNHLSRNQVPKPYFEALRNDKKYTHIINHKNYNPRIMEFVTQKHRYINLNPDDFFGYILSNLKDPREVWADEFDERLEEIDRIFMHTLFSLTNTFTDIDILKECFIFRLKNEGRGQSTIDYFSVVKTRLTKSLVKIFDVNGSQKIGVFNPSINDYMDSHLRSNTIGLNAIKDSILYIEQLEKMYEPKEAAEILINKLKTGEYLNLMSLVNKKFEYLYFGIATNTILKDEYKTIIKSNFIKLNESLSFSNNTIKKAEIVIKFLEDKHLFEFYDIGESLNDTDFVSDFITNLDFKGITRLLYVIKKEEILIPELIERLNEDLLDELNAYISDIDVGEYIESIDGYDTFYDLMPLEENTDKIDKAIKLLFSDIQMDIKKSLIEEMYQLDKTLDYEKLSKQIEDMVEESISEDTIFGALEIHFYPEPDFDYEYDDDRRGYDSGNIDVAYVIFNRDIVYDE